MNQPGSSPVQQLEVDLERDVFLRSLIRELAGSLQEVVGMEEAAGFISVVGQRVGDQINESYRQALGLPALDRQQVGQVLVDLKRRIQGSFSIVEEDEEKIVLANTACPFAEKVIGRPALCMMTSNVFGVIAAENLGYAKVAIEESIALGAPACRVVVYLQPEAAKNSSGREYYQG